MVYKEKRQDRDGVWITAHNGITQCAMPTSWLCNPYIVACSVYTVVLVGVALKDLLGGTTFLMGV